MITSNIKYSISTTVYSQLTRIPALSLKEHRTYCVILIQMLGKTGTLEMLTNLLIFILVWTNKLDIISDSVWYAILASQDMLCIFVSFFHPCMLETSTCPASAPLLRYNLVNILFIVITVGIWAQVRRLINLHIFPKQLYQSKYDTLM